MASNDKKRVKPNIATFLDTIKKKLKECKEEAFKGNELTSEDALNIQHEMSAYVRHLFSEYLLDFYAEPEYLRNQIEEVCESISINKEITQKIVSCLVDENGRNGRDPKFIFQGADNVENKLNKLRATGTQDTGNQDTDNKDTGNQATGNQDTGNQATENKGTGNQATGNQATDNKDTGNQVTENQATRNQDTGDQMTENQATGNQATENKATETHGCGKDTGNQGTGNQGAENKAIVNQVTVKQVTEIQETENQGILRFCKEIDAVTNKINWNKDFGNVINSSADNYNNWRDQIRNNLVDFLVTHNQKLSVIKPNIRNKKDLLPQVFIMMESDPSKELRIYEYMKYEEKTYWYQRFLTKNQTILSGKDYSFLKNVCLFSYRSDETSDNFILNKSNIIYMLKIIFPVNECKGENEADYRSLNYVGKASGGLLSRWVGTVTSHMDAVWKVWGEMQMRPIPTKLSASLSDCVLAYAHVMGYTTQLFVVDQVPENGQETLNACIKKAVEIITESKPGKRGLGLNQLWKKHYAEFKRKVAESKKEGVITRARAPRKAFPSYEFVKWYNNKWVRPGSENILDVYEQKWIDRMQSTVDNNGFNEPPKRHINVNIRDHFYELIKCGALYD